MRSIILRSTWRIRVLMAAVLAMAAEGQVLL